MTRAAQSKPEGQPHTRLDLVGRKRCFTPTRDAEDVVPYNVRYNVFVGTGVLDGPFLRKSYFVTVKGVEDVTYNILFP